VAVLVDTSTGWGRRLIYGIVQYGQVHGPWQFWIEPHGRHEHLRPPPGWQGEGIIARVSTPVMAKELREHGVPVVNISGIRLKDQPFPVVTTDQESVGKLAAEHFLDRGFRHFGYCGILKFSYVASQFHGFEEALKATGFTCDLYDNRHSGNDWRSQQQDLIRWIRQLPKPAAILTWAGKGRAVLEACSVMGVRVPEDVAVLDGDEDELLNYATNPPMSGVHVPSELIGREAAAMLDRLMSTKKHNEVPVLLKPTHVVVRQSTDTLAIDDPDLATAIRFVREHATEPIGVEDILRKVPIARRSLERRFEQILGRTPAAEIRRVRLETAQRLLIDTDMPIPGVAESSGFGSPEYLSYAFKRALGQTPLKYRSLMRARELPITDPDFVTADNAGPGSR
jgi:LacI family transcriptional regulator